MKTSIYILTIITLFSSCEYRQRNFQEQIKDIRQDFSKQAEMDNAKTLSWEKVIDSIYKLADTNENSSILAINSIILNDTNLNSRNLFDLYFIRGNLYFELTAYKEPCKTFQKDKILVHPKCLLQGQESILN